VTIWDLVTAHQKEVKDIKKEHNKFASYVFLHNSISIVIHYNTNTTLTLSYTYTCSHKSLRYTISLPPPPTVLVISCVGDSMRLNTVNEWIPTPNR